VMPGMRRASISPALRSTTYMGSGNSATKNTDWRGRFPTRPRYDSKFSGSRFASAGPSALLWRPKYLHLGWIRRPARVERGVLLSAEAETF
jgi:hypothetical protein